MKFFRSSHKLTLSLAALLVAFAIVPIVSVRSQNGQTQPPTLAAAGAGEDELGDDPTPHVEATAQPTPTATPTATPAPTPTPGPPKPPPPGPPDPPDPPLVYPGHSMLYWRVLDPKDVNDGTKPSMSDPIGGKVAIQVIIKIGRKGRLDPALNLYNTSDPNCPKPTGTLTFRLREEEDETNHIKHKDSENHADITTVFNDSQWEVWTSKEVYDGDPPPPTRSYQIGWTVGSPFSANSSDDTNYFYTRTLMWDTTREMGDATGKLLGHNGKHTISLVKVNDQEINSVNFQKKFPDQEEWQNAGFNVQKTTHEVGNLVITNVGTNQENVGEIADYFKFDPQSENDSFVHPVVRFNFAGFDQTTSKDRYNWWLYVRATTVEGYSNFLTYEGKVDKPGQVEVVINKESDSYQKTAGNDLNDWGTYAFDVTIQDTKTGDSIRLRTAPDELKTAPRLVDLNDQPFKNADGENIVDEDGKLLPGHELVVEEDDRDVEVPLQFFYSYTLRGKEDASKVRIDLLGPDLKLAATKDGGTKIGDYNYLPLFTANDDVQGSEGSGWKGVLIARDNLGENYRDHKNRSALAVNEEKFRLPSLWFSIRSADSAGVNVRNSPAKIVNAGEPKSKDIFPQIGEYPGRGLIPAFHVDNATFSSRFRKEKMKWNFSIDQGGDRIYVGPTFSAQSATESLRGGTPDTPGGVAPTVGVVNMKSTEGDRNAWVVIERAPMPPGERDKTALLSKLSVEGKAYILAQGLDEKLGIPIFFDKVMNLIDTRQEEIPPPNSTVRPGNTDAMRHGLFNSWLLRGLSPENYYITNPAAWERIQGDVLTITDAHEYSGYSHDKGENFDHRPDQVMDLINNRIARGGRYLIPNTMPASTKALGELTDDELFYPNLYFLLGPLYDPSNRKLPSMGGFVAVDEAADPNKSGDPSSGLLVPTPLKPWWVKKIPR